MNNVLPDLEASIQDTLARIATLQEDLRQARVAREKERQRAARKALLLAAVRPAIMAIVVSILTILAVHYWR